MQTIRRTLTHTLTRAARHLLKRLHNDDRGAISVLVLLTIWCLVALLAMIWNTGEEATRKQQLQAAADSASHAAATEMARIINATSAQNIVIAQDASTEIIWRAIPPTRDAIRARLTRELERLAAEDVDTDSMRRAIARRLDAVDRAFEPLRLELEALRSDIGCGITDPDELRRHQNAKRRARSVIAWVHDTYVEGARPPDSPGPPRPGPPVYDGNVGLRNIVLNFRPKASNEQIVQTIRDFILNQESVILAGFEERTATVLAQPIPALMAQHRASVYENQVALLDQFADTVESHRRAVSDYYKADITYASIGNPASEGPARFEPPVAPASHPESWWREDFIRHKYPIETSRAFPGCEYHADPKWHFYIDPINAHTGDSRLWHPDMETVIFPWVPILPMTGIKVLLKCEPPGGWGHSLATPIERHLHQRVEADRRELNEEYMIRLDDARSLELAAIIRELLGVPGDDAIATLPYTLPDDAPDPDVQPPQPPSFDTLPVPYMLRRPVNATAPYRDRIDNYNQAARTYCSEIRQLVRAIQDYRYAYGYYIERFAADAWHNEVDDMRRAVAEMLGREKQFTVMSTYALRLTPDWAINSMSSSVYTAVQNELVRRNAAALVERIVQELVDKDPYRWGDLFLDENARREYLRTRYYPYAAHYGHLALRDAVRSIANDITIEWLERPWPFEITPPATPAPPFKGLPRADRIRYFTAVAAARENALNQPEILMDWLFKPDDTRLVTTSQAEALNWMEFNESYGGDERFDQVTRVPWANPFTQYVHFVGAPRSWRDATIGGWNWRSRLTLGTDLFDAAQYNAEFRTYLQDAGMATFDRESFRVLQLH